MLDRTVVAAVACLSMSTGALAWDGARAYHLRPEGSNDLSLTMTLIHGAGTVDLGYGEETTELGVAVLTPAYRHTFDIMGNAGTVLIGMPVGNVSFSTSLGTIDVDTDVAQGDLFIGGVFGLVGMPSLAVMDYVQYKPGFQASIAGRLFLPTGDYDPDRAVSLGQNRWTLEASVPLTYVLGDTMVDPELTTFEVRPVVVIFGDNEDAVGPASVMSKDPVFGVEAHVTRNFGNSLWAGLDAYYEIGGETSLDGVAQDDELETFAVGATLGLVLSPQLAMRLTYRELVYSNQPDASGRSFEVATAFLF